MIVVDTSAVIAIIRNEPEALPFARELKRAELSLIAAPTRLEGWIVGRRARDRLEAEAFENILDWAGVLTIPFDEPLLTLAQEGFDRFGRGRGRANLNFGDCFSYALARQRGLPLLFKGDDFRATDIEAVL